MSRGTYAQATSVSVDRSMLELRRLLMNHMASAFVQGEEDGRCVVAFKLSGFPVRIEIPLPEPDDPEFTQTPTGLDRTENQRRQRYEQEVRRRWRVLIIAVKAKLELIRAGVSTVEREFFPDLVLPNGQTIGARCLPELDKMLSGGRMPALLPST